MGSGFYTKKTYDSAAKVTGDFPPPAGFYKLTVRDKAKVVQKGFPNPVTHAVVDAGKSIQYYNYDKNDFEFYATPEPFTKEDMADVAGTGWSFVYEEEDLPTQLGGKSTAYAPSGGGGGGGGSGSGSGGGGGGGGDKKKSSETSPLLIAALAAGAVYLLTRKKKGGE